MGTFLALLCISPALGGPRSGAGEDAAARIVGAALVESRAYEKLVHLSDRIGHRLSGSAALDRAIVWASEQYQRDGIDRVWTEKVMVPRWVRGEARASIVAPVSWDMATLALGGSVGTPEGGIAAEVIEARSLDELKAAGEAVRGKIVLFNKPIAPGFDSEHGYGSAVGLRVDGAAAAAKLGAVGMLIRSLGTADYRLPHTGAMHYEDGVKRIPAAAIAAEDAEMIHRLLASGGVVRGRLTLGCKTRPDVESANVIAELPGRDKPEEIVLIGAHLDSWDVGQGAQDDGAGCVIVMETLRLLERLDLIPRRTIRAVLFTNEENGLRGGRDYAEKHKHEKHVVAIESDSGGAAPLGFGVTAGAGAEEIVRGIARHLAAIQADQVTARGGGADISPLKDQGVPVMSLQQDPTHYFDYHHSWADTVDKVVPRDLDLNVAALAVMAFLLAEQDEVLPPPEAKKD